MPDPFQELRRALDAGETSGKDDREVRVDPRRRERTGAPEVVLAAGKSDAQILVAVRRLLEQEPRVIVSRCGPGQIEELRAALAPLDVEAVEGSGVAVVVRDRAARPETWGRVTCLSAGSSDIPVAMEAVIVAREMGCTIETAWDVGVAGLHRLIEPLRRLSEWQPDVIIVAAGMDGVLPTVVSGLIDIPIIGLPVANGYGHGGGGEAALSTMLQSCAPGVVVVNINNGIGAGVTAGLIANRMADARRGAG